MSQKPRTEPWLRMYDSERRINLFLKGLTVMIGLGAFFVKELLKRILFMIEIKHNKQVFKLKYRFLFKCFTSAPGTFTLQIKTNFTKSNGCFSSIDMVMWNDVQSWSHKEVLFNVVVSMPSN